MKEILIIAAVFSLYLIGLFFLLTKNNPIVEENKTIRLDYVMKCQELAAITQNESWKYTDCLKAIDEAMQPTKGKLL